jgi:hypothetical protein
VAQIRVAVLVQGEILPNDEVALLTGEVAEPMGEVAVLTREIKNRAIVERDLSQPLVNHPPRACSSAPPAFLYTA